jgi:hypothetical protein
MNSSASDSDPMKSQPVLSLLFQAGGIGTPDAAHSSI